MSCLLTKGTLPLLTRHKTSHDQHHSSHHSAPNQPYAAPNPTTKQTHTTSNFTPKWSRPTPNLTLNKSQLIPSQIPKQPHSISNPASVYTKQVTLNAKSQLTLHQASHTPFQSHSPNGTPQPTIPMLKHFKYTVFYCQLSFGKICLVGSRLCLLGTVS